MAHRRTRATRDVPAPLVEGIRHNQLLGEDQDKEEKKGQGHAQAWAQRGRRQRRRPQAGRHEKATPRERSPQGEKGAGGGKEEATVTGLVAPPSPHLLRVELGALSTIRNEVNRYES